MKGYRQSSRAKGKGWKTRNRYFAGWINNNTTWVAGVVGSMFAFLHMRKGKR